MSAGEGIGSVELLNTPDYPIFQPLKVEDSGESLSASSDNTFAWAAKYAKSGRPAGKLPGNAIPASRSRRDEPGPNDKIIAANSDLSTSI